MCDLYILEDILNALIHEQFIRKATMLYDEATSNKALDVVIYLNAF